MRNNLPIGIVITVLLIIAILSPNIKTKTEVIEEKEEVISKQDEQIEYIDYELDVQESRNKELDNYIQNLRDDVTWLREYIYEFIRLHPEHEEYFKEILSDTELEMGY